MFQIQQIDSLKSQHSLNQFKQILKRTHNTKGLKQSGVAKFSADLANITRNNNKEIGSH